MQLGSWWCCQAAVSPGKSGQLSPLQAQLELTLGSEGVEQRDLKRQCVLPSPI